MIMGLDESETALLPQPQPVIKTQTKIRPILGNMERVYEPEEDGYILVPKKDFTRT